MVFMTYTFLEPTRLRFQPIDGRGRRDVESAVVRIAPSQVGRLFRHGDRAQMISVSIPDPNAFRACHEEIAFLIHFHAIGNAFVLLSMFVAEDAAIA